MVQKNKTKKTRTSITTLIMTSFFMLGMILVLVYFVFGAVDTLSVSSCSSGTCTVANYNDNTTSIGHEITKNGYGYIVMTDSGATTGDTINDVDIVIRHGGETGIDGTLAVTIMDETHSTTYCSFSLTNTDGDVYEVIDTEDNGCSWTPATVNNLGVSFQNLDNGGGNLAYIYYTEVTVDYTTSGGGGEEESTSNLNYPVQEDFIPIFGYHKVLPDDETIDATSEIHNSTFREHLDYYTNTMNCSWITMNTLADHVNNKTKLPTNACIMTFDDGSFYDWEYTRPILDEYGIPATFYIITGRVGTASATGADGSSRSYYMTWDEINALVDKGHAVGSHTVNVSQGMITENLTYDEMMYQMNQSKIDLENQTNTTVKTFAYPLGEWNQTVLDIMQILNYSIGRDTSKDNTWRDRRPLTISTDSDYIYHFYYHKPELQNVTELANDVAYRGWWQFEEDYNIDVDTDSGVITITGEPTNTSYAIVYLDDTGDRITNDFLIQNPDNFTIEVFGYTSYDTEGTTTPYTRLNRTDVWIDGVEIQQYYNSSKTVATGDCTNDGSWYYCPYYVDVELTTAGVHNISIEADNAPIRVDKWRIWSETDSQDFYYTTDMDNYNASAGNLTDDSGGGDEEPPAETSTDPLADGQIAYWKCDNTTELQDSHSTHDGIKSGSPTHVTDGFINGAWSFDDTTEYFTVTDHVDFDSTDLTISFWVNCTNPSSLALDPVAKYLTTDNNREWITRIHTDDHARFFADDTGTTATGTYSGAGTDICDGTWHHYIARVNGTIIDHWVDGTFEDDADMGGNLFNGIADITIAKDVSGDAYAGLIDEIAIWNRTLNSSEISRLYNSSLGLQYPYSTSTTTDSCTPPETTDTDWIIDSSDNCEIADQDINLGTGNLYFNGTGTIIFTNCNVTAKAFERQSGDSGTSTEIWLYSTEVWLK